MTLPLSQDSPGDSPKGDSRFSRFFKNLRGNESRESLQRKQSLSQQSGIDQFKSREYSTRDSLPITPDVDVNQYFSQVHKTTGYESREPENPRDLVSPEQRGMLGVYEDFMRAQRGKEWRDGDFDSDQKELESRDVKEMESRDLKIEDSRDMSTMDWSRDTDNATLTARVPSSMYSMVKENPYESRDMKGTESREVYDYVIQNERNHDTRDLPTPPVPRSRSQRASRILFTLCLACLLILLKTHVTTIILNYGITDSQIYSQTACATLNTYAATTHFGPNLLYSSVTGQAASHVGALARDLLPLSDVTMKSPEWLGGLLGQLKDDYVSSILQTVDFGVKLTKNESIGNARDAQEMLTKELQPLQANITLFESSLSSLSANLLSNPIFGFEKSDNTSKLNLDGLKGVNFTKKFLTDFLPLFSSPKDVSDTFDSPFSSAKNALLSDFENFNSGLRKLALNMPTAKSVTKQLQNSSYNQLFSSFQLCTKEEEIKNHFEKMETGVNKKSGVIIGVFVGLSLLFLLITCFLELYSLVRKRKVEKTTYLRKLTLSDTKAGAQLRQSRDTIRKSRDLIPLSHHFSALSIITVAVAVSCICDLSLLSSLRISGGAEVEFVTNMNDDGGHVNNEKYGHVVDVGKQVNEHRVLTGRDYIEARDLAGPESRDTGYELHATLSKQKRDSHDSPSHTYSSVDYMAIFSTPTPAPAFKAVQKKANSSIPVEPTIATLHNISSDITRLIDSANIYLEGLQTNLQTECASYEKELLSKVQDTLSKLEGDLANAVSKRFGLSKSDVIGYFNKDKFLKSVLDKTQQAVAPATSRKMQIDAKAAVASLYDAHVTSLPGFAPLETKTTIATSLENLVGMMQKVVTSQQWFALGFFLVWLVLMLIGGVRWVFQVKREGGWRGRKWEV